MVTIYELRRHTATLIFNLEDRFARARGTRGPHPRPFEPIKFFITARGVGLGREEFDPPLELVTTRNGGGYHVFNNMIKQPTGALLKGALADGIYDLRVEGRFYQRAVRAGVTLPTTDRAIFFRLRPSYSYPFPSTSTLPGGRGLTLLRGSLHTTEGRGIADAIVRVLGVGNPYRTDETGQWVIFFPDSQPSGNVTVRVTFPNLTVVDVLNVAIEQGRERGLGETALRGWVLTNGGTVIPGATVEVQGQPGQTQIEGDGSWFYYFGLNQPAGPVDVTARLPDGRSQTQNNQLVQPRSTVVVPTFRFP